MRTCRQSAWSTITSSTVSDMGKSQVASGFSRTLLLSPLRFGFRELGFHLPIALERGLRLILVGLDAVEALGAVGGLAFGRQAPRLEQRLQQLRGLRLLLEHIAVAEAGRDRVRRPAAGVARIQPRALLDQILHDGID